MSRFIYFRSKFCIKNKYSQSKFAALLPRKQALLNDCITQTDKNSVIDGLVSIVNHAYIVGEHSMWIENYNRTDYNDIEQKLNNEMLILLVKVDNGSESECHEDEIVVNETTIIGQILCDTKFDTKKGMAEFGILAIHEEYQKLGLGKLLISAAEERAKYVGCKTLQWELLSPTTFEHDVKTWLSLWYKKL